MRDALVPNIIPKSKSSLRHANHGICRTPGAHLTTVVVIRVVLGQARNAHIPQANLGCGARPKSQEVAGHCFIADIGLCHPGTAITAAEERQLLTPKPHGERKSTRSAICYNMCFELAWVQNEIFDEVMDIKKICSLISLYHGLYSSMVTVQTGLAMNRIFEVLGTCSARVF
jgi:hypothetical protein